MNALERAYLVALKAAAKPRRIMATIYGGKRVPPGDRLAVVHGAVSKVARDLPDEFTKLAKLLEAHSMERYNGGIKIKRIYGSSTVTKFLVRPKGEKSFGDPQAIMVEGYGPTPGERKTFAMRKAAQILWQRGVI